MRTVIFMLCVSQLCFLAFGRVKIGPPRLNDVVMKGLFPKATLIPEEQLLIEDLSTISKGGDALATYNSRTRTINIEMPLRFDSLMVSYKFDRHFIFHHRGDVFGKVENVKIDCKISFNYGTYQLKLDHFQVKDKSKLTVHYSGDGIIHWVTETLINFTIGFLHYPLIHIIESSVRYPLEDMIITVNKFLDRQNKSYSSAWVNGVSVRSNFTQTILDHEKSQQHISASLSYNNWLQGNTIDTLLKSEIDSKITFWRDVLHPSCNLALRGHDSDSGNFMAISRLLSNYDATLKELLLKPKGGINYLSPTIQNEIISLLGTTVRNNIISENKKAPFLTIILDTTQDLSKIDQLSVVFRYISATENDDNSFLGFIAVIDCSAAGLKTVILNLTKEYGIDLTKCRGQGCDGANVMSGVYGRLQTLIKEHAPNADYVHCAAHALTWF
nr:unnamed protein product [Callosobruchus analis]